jgi:hypothetical protein
MPRYAAQTEVPVERTRAEIEKVLLKYEAEEFHSGWRTGEAMIAFRIQGLFVRFLIPFPPRDDEAFTWRVNKRTGRREKLADSTAARLHEQAIRQRWRALLLVVKAKLEAVECGISTIEREFLAFVVMPNDQTFFDWLAEETAALTHIRRGEMPALPAPKGPRIVDAEAEDQRAAQ